jgi:hypothetical protein
MLTLEQQKARRDANEIQALRTENERLKRKLGYIYDAVTEMLQGLKLYATYAQRVQLDELIKELKEASK